MILLFNENHKIDKNSIKLKEENASSYVAYLFSNGIAKIDEKDEKSRNVFYGEINEIRAKSMAKYNRQKNDEGHKMEWFMDINDKPISEDQFQMEVISILLSKGISDEVATGVTNNYLKVVHEEFSKAA